MTLGDKSNKGFEALHCTARASPASTFLLLPQCARERLRPVITTTTAIIFVLESEGRRNLVNRKAHQRALSPRCNGENNPRAAAVRDGALPPLSVLLSCSAVRAVRLGAGATPPCDVGLSFTGILGEGLVGDGGGRAEAGKGRGKMLEVPAW